MVPYAGEYLRGSGVLVCTVIGFPLGAGSSAVKAFETEDAVRSGADEIDMVINIGALKEKDYKTVKRDISEVAGASGGKLVKVIFETCLLTDDEIKTASNISMEAGANYVKTSTGFSTGGATESAIKIMRGTVGSELGVKASGGVRDSAGFYAMLKAGATRIGASAGVAIVTGQSAPEGKY
jgi:deoxyribose-phosphate aldolase